ncbi:serine/threonine protein kinase [Waterburya agarophytonicola K14]|uniref:non-specific serine/threonine protein kinase n=1 Tax=Waterburya agarophytonicola KI4 TaxID=2874699 RepID=A0A964BW58_9CYAN|nr:serine/threonine-protein kinase [Waterburya agarophytonicola]MCC0179318.1 serine/threonine protein kinase [Waterburya agarophytonicola KI4]
MSEYPNLNKYGYQIDAQLGCNREGGRITWKGKHLTSQKIVAIKQFCFAKKDSSWSGYKAYEQEIKLLQQLNHPGIPQYLDSIETENGFCLIQEYIPASSLNNYNQLTLLELQQIILKFLEILIYLQQQNPPILHRDIKPENILLDEKLRVYLIDFGFASLGNKEASGSSVFKGTPGFIAPEQIVKPGLASDIYSLGVTIVCLLSNKSIVEIRDSVSTDDPYQLDLKSLFPELNRQFLSWLEKMTNAKASKRFSNALAAREALLSVDLEDITSGKILRAYDLNINYTAKAQVISGTFAIASLTTIAMGSVGYINNHLESSIVDIAIAILAGIVIGITQLGAVEIAKTDNSARIQGGILAVGVPIVLVAASGVIWGRGEAVDIAGTIIIAEILILAYFWWQIPWVAQRSLPLKSSFLFVAIALGITFGLQLI